MPVIRDPTAINYLKVNQTNGISPAAVLTDEDGALFGVPGNEISVIATLVSSSFLSVGPTGAAVPSDANQIGGPDPGGLLRAPRITTADPVAADPAMVVRNIPSGTQEVSAPGGGALALDATLTSGTVLAQVAGTGTAGAPAAGVVTVQGIGGGTPIPISGTVSAVDPSVGVNGAAIPLSSTQVGGTDGGTLRPWAVDAAGAGLIRAASLPLPTGAATEATLTGVLTTAAFQARINTLGQKTMANSTPVVLASDQSAIPVSFPSPADVTVINDVVLKTDLVTQPARDAFQRVRSSQPETIFDSKTISDNLPLVYDDQQTAGAGTSSTFSSNRASVTLGVSAATAGTRVRQTFQHFNYQPGKSQLVLLTGVVGAAAAGITKRWGLFQASNGLFFEQNSTGLRVAVRSFVTGVAVTTYVDQASWNIDPMDGTGPSGITLDPTKTQIFVMDFQWLGVGSIRFGVSIGGAIYYVHKVDNANVQTAVYMSSPNLPVRWEIENSGAGGAATVEVICATVISEGGQSTPGGDRGTDRGNTPVVTLNSAALFPLIAIRLKSTYLGSFVKPLTASIICTSTSAYRWMLLRNPTVVGVALAFASVADSAVEAAVTMVNTTTVTGGTLIASGYALAANDGGVQLNANTDFALGSNIAGTSDILVLAIQRLTGTTETFYASMGWHETQ